MSTVMAISLWPNFLRKSFYTSFRLPLGFFANLRRTCEGFAKKGKRRLSPEEDQAKNWVHLVNSLCFFPTLIPISWQTDQGLVLQFSRFFPLSPVKTGRMSGESRNMPGTRSEQGRDNSRRNCSMNHRVLYTLIIVNNDEHSSL